MPGRIATSSFHGRPVRRVLTGTVGVVAAAVFAAGCGGNAEPDAAATSAAESMPEPTTAEATSEPTEEAAAGPFSAACPLLTADEVMQTFGAPAGAVVATEGSPTSIAGQTVYTCVYTSGDTPGLSLTVSAVAGAAGSAQVVIDQAATAQGATGVEALPGLGDAAGYYTGASGAQVQLVTAKSVGSDLHVVALTGLPDMPKDALIALAQLVLTRV